jgi:hypothetical protein
MLAFCGIIRTTRWMSGIVNQLISQQAITPVGDFIFGGISEDESNQLERNEIMKMIRFGRLIKVANRRSLREAVSYIGSDQIT